MKTIEQFLRLTWVESLKKNGSILAATIILDLSGMGAPSAVNRIETSPNLNLGSWTTLTSITTDATGVILYDDTNATGAREFYRLGYP
jgi:hypothetical protein